MKQIHRIGMAVAAIGVVGSAAWLMRPKSQALNLPAEDKELIAAIKDAAKDPKGFVAKNEASKDVKVQTAVTRARMSNAYQIAQKKDFAKARAEFMQASYQHKGSDAMNPAYGTLTDQAAYQAIVCLEADGKKDEAAREYRKFMEERKLSPLVHACFRRLERLNGNKPKPEDEALLQVGIDAQEKQIRFETSVCGPKALEKLLPLYGKPAKDYKEIAKLAGTTDEGTTMEGLKTASEELGLQPVGLDLNAKDFNAMKKPFIRLLGDHYLLVLEIKDGQALIFDSRFRSEDWVPLPKEDDGQFRATVLAFELPTSNLIHDHAKPVKKS
jgi:hypothetical protein